MAALTLVRDGQSPPALRPATLEDNPTVLRRHPNPETVRFLTPTVVRLVGALAFHAGPVVCLRDWAGTVPCVNTRGIFNTSHRLLGVSTIVLHCRVPKWDSCCALSPFGVFPKISTPVEKIVEKREFRMGGRGKRHFWPDSAGQTLLTRAICHTLVISPFESGQPRLAAPE
jgi:hypothetical protein